MRKIVTLTLLSFLAITSYGQKTWPEVMKVLSGSAEEYLQSYINQEWDKYIELTHPNIVELAGGNEILKKLGTENIQMYESLGYELGGVKIGDEIETADSKEGIQALVPGAMILKNGDENVETPMKLFAISSDLGATWKFVDLTQYDPKSIKQFVPEFDANLLESWSTN